jgi:hypothetical protein
MTISAERWSKVLLNVGYSAMLLGALDLMEGSLLILPGSAFVAAGTYLDPASRRFLAHRLLVLLLLAVGIGAMFGLSAFGGVGAKSGLSWGWGLLVVPYVVGWPLGLLGPGVPRWVNYGAVVVGLWLLTLAAILLSTALRSPNPVRPFLPAVMVIVAVLGLVAVVGGIWRLRLAQRK